MQRLIRKYPARLFPAILLALGFIAVLAHPVTHSIAAHGHHQESHQQSDVPLPAAEDCLECTLILTTGSDIELSAPFYLPLLHPETVIEQAYIAEPFSADGFTLRGPPSLLYI